MTSTIVPLHNKEHSNLKILNSKFADHVKSESVIPIVVHEFENVSAEYPIVFVKNSETGQFTSVALVGLKPNENLFVENKTWQGDYVPSIIRGYPLKILVNPDNQEEMMMGIDRGSSLVNTEKGEALFNDQGQETDFLMGRKNELIHHSESSHVTESFIDLMSELEILIQKTLTVTVKDETMNLEGLYFINEEKLNDLSESEFLNLRKRGFLPVIYAHLNSMHQMKNLIKRKSKFS